MHLTSATRLLYSNDSRAGSQHAVEKPANWQHLQAAAHLPDPTGSRPYLSSTETSGVTWDVLLLACLLLVKKRHIKMFVGDSGHIDINRNRWCSVGCPKAAMAGTDLGRLPRPAL